jgi:hypothetical protein
MFHMKSALATAALSWLALAAWAAPPLTADRFQQIHAVVKPAKDEDKWATIPWQIDLWEARKQAAAQGKPILLWEMDGHPLGCT